MENLFLESSRYYKQKTVTTATKSGRAIVALKLRILPPANGEKRIVGYTDRLDIIAQRKYNDSTKFWHIADANTELEARNLIKKGKAIEVPKT